MSRTRPMRRCLTRAASLATSLAAAHPRPMLTSIAIVLAVTLAAALALTRTAGRAWADPLLPITDLPWIESQKDHMCGWHCDCTDGVQREPGEQDHGCSGVDFDEPAGTLVTSAGAGTLSQAGPSGFGFGNRVQLDHSPSLTEYAHLRWWFWPAPGGGGERICQSTPLGYSGSSGTDIPHLHFAARSGPGAGQDLRWTPIHGDRRQPPVFQHSYGEATFDHSGSSAHFGHGTRAYMVDDSQRAARRGPEFFLHGAIGIGGWRRFDQIGFGYGGESSATMWSREAFSEGLGATWDPILPVADTWNVFVFVPSEHATAGLVRYFVHVNHSGGFQQLGPFLVDQARVVNEWVPLTETRTGRLAEFTTFQPGQWQLSVRLEGCDGCRPGAEIGADAVLFVPEDCLP